MHLSNSMQLQSPTTAALEMLAACIQKRAPGMHWKSKASILHQDAVAGTCMQEACT